MQQLIANLIIQMKNAKLARELKIKIVQPSLHEFNKIITENYLPSFPVTKADIMTSEHIFGLRLGD